MKLLVTGSVNYKTLHPITEDEDGVKEKREITRQQIYNLEKTKKIEKRRQQVTVEEQKEGKGGVRRRRKNKKEEGKRRKKEEKRKEEEGKD